MDEPASTDYGAGVKGENLKVHHFSNGANGIILWRLHSHLPIGIHSCRDLRTSLEDFVVSSNILNTYKVLPLGVE